MTWQLWQQQQSQPAFPSRTFVLDKLKSGDDCWCRVSEWICKNLLTMRDFPSSQNFKISLSLSYYWYCWQNTDMPCRPLLLMSLDFLLLFFLVFSTHWWSTGMILLYTRTLLHDQAFAEVLPEIDVWWVKKLYGYHLTEMNWIIYLL